MSPHADNGITAFQAQVCSTPSFPGFLPFLLVSSVHVRRVVINVAFDVGRGEDAAQVSDDAREARPRPGLQRPAPLHQRVAATAGIFCYIYLP